MNVVRQPLPFPLLLVSFFSISGCSSSAKVDTAPKRPSQEEVLAAKERERNHDRALSHFIDGSVHDAKGEYATAVLDYQDALRYEPSAAIYNVMAKDYGLLGKPLNAAEAAREAIRLEPSKIPYHETLAGIYLGTFQQEQAIHEYEAIVHIDSNYVNGWFNLARLYQSTKPLRALEIYERLRDRNGDDWDLLLQTAELNSALGRYLEAADRYRRMLEIDPGNKPLRRQLAETYGKAGKFDEAIRIFETLLDEDPDNQELTATLADLYLDQNQFAKAVALYQKLLDKGATSPEIKLRVGVGYFNMARKDSTYLPKAKEVFQKVQQDLPNDWRVYWYLGAVAANEKNDSLSTYYFEHVVRLDGRNADAWSFIGTSYYEHGEYQKLIEAMERAQQILPKESRLYFLTGLAYSRLEQTDKALAALEKAYQLNPKDINTIGQLALTYDGLHRNKDSDRLYEEALKIDPKSSIILNNYGYSLAERGLQLQRALEMAKQAVTAEPNNSSYLDTYGWIFYKLENYGDAAVWIEKAVAAGKASAVVQEHLGDVYYKQGQRTKAVETWRKALEMDRKNQALKDKIDRGSL